MLEATVKFLNASFGTFVFYIPLKDSTNIQEFLKTSNTVFLIDPIESFYKSLNSLFGKFYPYLRVLIENLSMEFLILKVQNFLGLKNSYARLLQNVDLVIMPPGGYLHPYYNIKTKLFILEKVLQMNKKLIFLNQSISPLEHFESNDKRRLLNVLDSSTCIICREAITYKNYNFLKNTMKSTDLAFLLFEPNYRTEFSRGNRIRVILNIRDWKELKLQFIIEIINHLIYNLQADITFASTCQGIEGYTDDSLFCKNVLSKHAPELLDRIRFSDIHLNRDKFQQLAIEHDIYIGMRLHGAIFSMLSGIPAMNMYYESKSVGIYHDLNLEKDLLIDMNESTLFAFEKIAHVINNLEDYKSKVNLACEKAKNILGDQVVQMTKLL